MASLDEACPEPPNERFFLNITLRSYKLLRLQHVVSIRCPRIKLSCLYGDFIDCVTGTGRGGGVVSLASVSGLSYTTCYFYQNWFYWFKVKVNKQTKHSVIFIGIYDRRARLYNAKNYYYYFTITKTCLSTF